MAIEFWLGKPGSGKTYSAARLAKTAVESGRVVVTNLPLLKEHETWQAAREAKLLFQVRSTNISDKMTDVDHFGGLPFWKQIFVGPDDNISIPEHLVRVTDEKTVGPLLIIDEVGSSFSPLLPNRGGAATSKLPDHLRWLTRIFETHRHHGVDIIIIGQGIDQIPVYWRKLAECAYEYKNTQNFFGPGLRGKGSYWRLLRTNLSHIGTSAPPQGKTTSSFSNEIYQLYDGFAEGAATGTTNRGRVKVKPFWLHWQVIFFVFTLFALAYAVPLSFRVYNRLLGSNGSLESRVIGSPALAASPSSVSLPAAAVVIGALPPSGGGIYRSGPVLLGYTDTHIYLVDGSRIGILDDLPRAGYRLVASSSARIFLVRVDEDGSSKSVVWSIAGAL